MKRLGLSLTAAMLLGAVAAGPAAGGAVVPPEYGSAVKCKYLVTAYEEGEWYRASLRAMVVIPPVMYATEDGNKVGWRFLITRSTDNGPHLRIYKSVTQKRVATTSTPAEFEARRVLIEFPGLEHPNLAKYRAVLVMLHYNADGSLNTRTEHTLTNVITTFDGVRVDRGLSFCEGKANAGD